jgi:Ecdysteroid kinase-like family
MDFGRHLATVGATARSFGQLGLALSPWVPAVGPSRAGDVDEDFVTRHVGAGVAGARCEQVRPLDGSSGTTDRRRIGLTWNDAGVAAGLPASVYVKSTPLGAKNRAMVGPLDMAVNEARFYNEVRPALGDVAPISWYAHAGNGARHLLLLEDLVARGCTPFALSDACTIDHARAIVIAQASLHASMWQSPRLAADLAWVKRWSERPGYLILRTFYRRGRRGAIKTDRPEITPAVRRLADALDAHADALYALMEDGPLTFLHGDPHFGNSYATADGLAGYLDWQVVWQGPGLRDVTYFITGALEPDVRRTCERELLQTYLDELARHGVADVLTLDAAFERYRCFAAEAWDAGAMTVAWPGLQAPENVDAAFRRGCAAVEDLEVATAVEALADG